MIAAILIQEGARVRRQIECQQEVLVEFLAAHDVNGTLPHTDRACRKKTQCRRTLQILQLQKGALVVGSRDDLKSGLRISKLCRPLRRRNDRSLSVENFQELQLVILRHCAGQIEILSEV